MESKAELLALLTQEYRDYCEIPVSEVQQKREKKSFINGLMTACRVIGISFDELNEIVGVNTESKFETLEEKLEIPTYIRNKIEI
ncbi:conserved hypothetical protein [Vibrio vulnificus YJ016]|uniref:Uncharacterized protein n=1 Tax=Vibrio vulnificus (strain YJ016) TaxID=196600 RepID=Q7M7B1_VIBVY|nr:hypothetical protein [Vibrio vulnificus]EJT0555797.1 hypothetical protein [Vibrio vulnificus]ELE2043523.1 hypothetical protein [Vibrio vulnificus]MBN8133638.1 hypothetical protein [Vibrio vulnificus]MBN8138232.1 hypothetical protein [Vibrio vulnificus]MBN8161478.1 hypothetical protein [Vibrio vulnificus]